MTWQQDLCDIMDTLVSTPGAFEMLDRVHEAWKVKVRHHIKFRSWKDRRHAIYRASDRHDLAMERGRARLELHRKQTARDFHARQKAISHQAVFDWCIRRAKCDAMKVLTNNQRGGA